MRLWEAKPRVRLAFPLRCPTHINPSNIMSDSNSTQSDSEPSQLTGQIKSAQGQLYEVRTMTSNLTSTILTFPSTDSHPEGHWLRIF